MKVMITALAASYAYSVAGTKTGGIAGTSGGAGGDGAGGYITITEYFQ
jgi:hypothetical protein